jgi:hypothetical protein
MTELSIEEDELGLVYTKSTRVVLEKGTHKIHRESEMIKVRKRDSLTIEPFDVLSSNAKSLYCQVTVNYAITARQLENIAVLLERLHRIKLYRELAVVPETESAIRIIAESYDDKELVVGNYELEDFEKRISENLKKYANIKSIALKFYRR